MVFAMLESEVLRKREACAMNDAEHALKTGRDLLHGAGVMDEQQLCTGERRHGSGAEGGV